MFFKDSHFAQNFNVSILIITLSLVIAIDSIFRMIKILYIEMNNADPIHKN